MTLSLAGYTDLQATALDFMERTGVAADTAAAPVWVQLAEARLNRELGPVEADASLTGTIGSRSLDISAISMVEPVALFIADSSSDDEGKMLPFAGANMPFLSTSGAPTKWMLDSFTTIKLDRPCDSAYAFRLRYRQRFALATTSPNWLLTNHPDVYLAATLMWGAGYNETWASGQAWKAILDEAIPSIRNTLAKGRKGRLVVDPGLLTNRNGITSLSAFLNGNI